MLAGATTGHQPVPDRHGRLLHAQLDYIEPAIWRRLEVPAGLNLDDLHWILQMAFGWQNSHMHAFTQGRRRLENERIGIGDVLRQRRDRITYEYDFGDSWTHTVEVEELLPDGVAAVRCVAGARAAPPEDCGGVPGYYDLVDALTDPKHPDREDLLEWAGDYDPEAFDVNFINRALARIPVRRLHRP